ncbi:MAG TPA: nickel pincer cofactor biosynthesis protein LarC [Terriglobales bacterium]|nr:nickel pincer cofactor biosynthesis protein LarC [Terriglobales bacterium]
MRIAYLDCFSGVSGDMFLGALVDAGVSVSLLQKTVAALGVEAQLQIAKVTRGGIAATKVDVYAVGEKDRPRDVTPAPSPVTQELERHAHSHGQAKGSTLAHCHSPDLTLSTPGGAALPGHTHRGLAQIKQIISRAAISDAARRTALEIFDSLAAAEAAIHHVDIQSVHFHEVGAIDAMVDIVCAAVGAEALGVDEMVCSPLNVGSGTVVCAHGTFPVPAPATVELLKGAPVYSSGIEAELVTPTGAAIVKALATRFAPFPEMKIENAGYGAGTRDFPGYPNVLRLTIGEQALGATTAMETITVLEANLDDLNPQVFGYVMDRLLAEGALEAFGMPVQMKKNRPGMLLTVLCEPESAAKLTQLIFTETTTLGVRRRDERRQSLARRWVNVRIPWGEVRMKVASLNGTVTNFAPEYEDCRRIAAAHHVPLKTVLQEATREYLKTVDRG